jgi:hypothetical protein
VDDSEDELEGIVASWMVYDFFDRQESQETLKVRDSILGGCPEEDGGAGETELEDVLDG